MSKPDVAGIVHLAIDFIVQNVSASTLQCHFDDGWGPSTSDPKGIEGVQDCLADRYHLCAMHGEKAATPDWFSFTSCVYLNQAAVDNITDHRHRFHATMQYCSAITSGANYDALQQCAMGDEGLKLLEASHARERAGNTHSDKAGHHHPDWIVVDGVDMAANTTADWLQLVCQAQKKQGGALPKSCATYF